MACGDLDGWGMRCAARATLRDVMYSLWFYSQGSPVMLSGSVGALVAPGCTAPSDFASGDSVLFILKLRPAGCSKLSQEMRGCRRKPRGG